MAVHEESTAAGYMNFLHIARWALAAKLYGEARGEHFRFGPVLDQNKQPNCFFFF
jgi:hypothetical protein